MIKVLEFKKCCFLKCCMCATLWGRRSSVEFITYWSVAVKSVRIQFAMLLEVLPIFSAGLVDKCCTCSYFFCIVCVHC